MYKPSPVPLGVVVKNGSKIKSTISGATPVPQSMTSRVGRCSVSRPESSRISGRAGVGRAVAQRVLAQVGHHLVQLFGVHAYLDALGGGKAENFARHAGGVRVLAGKLPQPGVEREAHGADMIAPAQLGHVFHDDIHAPALVVDDLDQAPAFAVLLGCFTQQLGGIRQRAERVADFMRNRGREPRERLHFHLLRLLFQHRHILEKNKRAGVLVIAECREAR